MFIGWAHDSNKTQDMHEEILPTGEEIAVVLSAQLVLTMHHPLVLLLHILALGCAVHTAWWVCPIIGAAWVVCGGNTWELVYLGQNPAAASFLSVFPSPRHYV